jgi:hypothetical protein
MPFFPQFSNLFVAPYIPPLPAERILWLKADAGVTTSGATVTAWADQSGKGNNAVPYGSPEFSPNQLNSTKPVIYFDGTAYFVAPLSLPSTKARTIFLVGTYGGTDGPQQGFLNLANGGQVDKGYLFKSNGNDDSYWYNTGQVKFPTTYSVGNYNIFTVENYTSGISNVGIFNEFLSGTVACPTADRVIIASRFENLDETADCSIAEIIIYDGILTNEQRNTIINDLNTKYAIYPWRVTISGAGTTTSNGEYVWDGVERNINGQPIYRKTSNSNSNISWEVGGGSNGTGTWNLYDADYDDTSYNIESFNFSGNWLISNGASPVPTSTLSYTP